MPNILEEPSSRRCGDFLAAVARSRSLHRPWAAPRKTEKAFAQYLKRIRNSTHAGYWVRTEDGELAGAITVSEIVRGSFLSGYLGYYAFMPHHHRGYMTLGLQAVVRKAFHELRLHRLEANIQPENVASRQLVRRLGFRKEGLSLRYLKIGGRWRDHERWALTVEDWSKRGAR